MLRFPLARAAAGLALMFALTAPVGARVLTLSAQSDTQAIVRDASDGNVATSTLTSPQGRLLIEPGALAADADNDLVYVGVNQDPAGLGAGLPATVRVGQYGNVAPPMGMLDAPDGRYFAALAFDAPASTLIGVLADTATVTPASAQIVSVTTNGGSAFGTPVLLDTQPDCCRFVSGIAAWRASTRDLLMVGRRMGDTEDQLLRFHVDSAATLAAYPITDDHIVALAVDAQTGDVYALARSTLDFTYLARVTWSTDGTPATLSAIGSAPAACCYVAAGPAAIDGATRALFALTRNASAPGPMQLSRFDFASGNPLVVNDAIDGYGLWSDPAALLDRIFADGFD